MKFITFLILLLQCPLLFAYEYSPFRCYYKVREEAERFEKMQGIVNSFTSRRLSEAIEAANKSNQSQARGCDPTIIENAIKSKLDDEIVGQVEEYANNNEEHACHVPRKKSIYAAGLTFDMMTVLDAVTKKGSLQPMIYMCGKSFGVDKFGHFMAQGHTYFERIRSSGSSDLAPGFEYGDSSENGFYGLSATGVKSYGDLGANFSGMLFWQHFYSEDGSDPLAYVKCEDGNFKATERKWDWCDHVLSSWDEANNCSEFNDTYAEAVPKNLALMAKRDKKPFQCPMEPSVCEQAISEAKELLGSRNYEKFKNSIISPVCQQGGAISAESSAPENRRRREQETRR